MEQLTVGSLFSGIGMFDLGFQRAGMQIKWQCEIDEFCRAVLKKHWPNVTRYKDVKSLKPEYADVICLGFPCQDISVAGKAAGLTGKRSGLWFEAARIVGELRPRYVVIENVPALKTRGLDTVLADLASCGYDAEWQSLPASAFGAPHKRERIWIVAYPNSDELWDEPGRWNGTNGKAASELAKHGKAQQLADASSKGLQRRAEPKATSRSQSNSASSGSHSRPANLAYTDEFGRVWRSRKIYEEDRGRQSTNSGWWESEPNLGRGLDGYSAWLDDYKLVRPAHLLLLVYGFATKRTSDQVLSAMRNGDAAQEIQREIGGCIGLSTPQILLSYLRQLSNRVDHIWLQMESEKVTQGSLRGLWSKNEPTGTSRRSKSQKQQAKERTDALQAVSRLLAFDAEASWLKYRGSNAAVTMGWEDGISRVISYSRFPNRNNRLKSLGNALVPQIAEYIGQKIIEREERNEHGTNCREAAHKSTRK